MEIENRYERQIDIPQIGTEGQKKLAQSSLLVVGAGGLGAPLLYALAGAGIGHLTIVDGDYVSMGNLNRQFLYTQAEIGFRKADMAAVRLRRFNPEIQIEAIHHHARPNNVETMVDGKDMVIVAADNISTRLLLNRVCAKRNIPLINGGVEGLYGALMAIEYGKTPCLECFYAHTAAKRESGTALGAVSSVIASLMANTAIEMLLEKNPIPGEMLLYDGVRLTLEKVPVSRDPNCRICGEIKND